MRRVIAGSALSLTVLAVSILALAPVSTSIDREPDVFQFSRAYRGRIVALKICEGIDCVQGVPEGMSFELPEGMGRVDLEVSLTMEYQTSRGDPG